MMAAHRRPRPGLGSPARCVRHGGDGRRRGHPQPRRRQQRERRAAARCRRSTTPTRPLHRPSPKTAASRARAAAARCRRTFTTGYRYAGLGYTTVFDAARGAAHGAHAHGELDDTPIVDAGLFVLMGNDDYLLRLIRGRERTQARDYAAWLLGAAGGLRRQSGQPRRRGVVEARRTATAWASTRQWRSVARDAARDSRNASSVPATAWACPHAGATSTATTWEWPATSPRRSASLRAVAGRRAHFTHLQFHAYDAAADGTRRSGARSWSRYLNAHPEISGDVGQVMFGAATTLTADSRGRVSALQEQRPPLGERGRRARDGLRQWCR